MEHLQRVLDLVGDLKIDQEALKKKVKRLSGDWPHVREELKVWAIDNISAEEPDWTFVAARLHLDRLYDEVAENRGNLTYYEVVEKLVEEGYYRPELLERYTKEELDYFGSLLDPERDKLFTYAGLRTMMRYLTVDGEGRVLELPQERIMTAILFLLQAEDRETLGGKERRRELVEEAYWALSNQYATFATPTFKNAGRTFGQLSSCFVDTVDDSIEGIFDTNTRAARLTKGGGGLGVYLGHIRSEGSDIKGFKNTSRGVIPWMRQFNNTIASVDQLKQRVGAMTVWLDVWHKDILDFLDAKLNNGDERRRTHDLHLGVCIPDEFMRRCEQDEDWYLIDPHEVKKVYGKRLQDFYDEQEGGGSWTAFYEQIIREGRVDVRKVRAREIMRRIMRSQLETGEPFMFYRDTVNRANPNKHCGIVYCSNLCTEILQNQSETRMVGQDIDVDTGRIVTYHEPGDLVVCNLASLNLGRLLPKEKILLCDSKLPRVISILVRLLDWVITFNPLEVPEAKQTNEFYRAIGLGTYGWHHLLAKKGIQWESEDAVELADELYEEIAYHAIKASCQLAKERGPYFAFQGSEWHTGEYFRRRGYVSERWQELMKEVQHFGVRNAYIMAVAPNSSTALIAGTTAGIDPIYSRVYVEEKKDYRTPVTAPELSPETYWYYKPAHQIDQVWSIKQNAARQRHIDQGISFNFYVSPDIQANDFFRLHLEAWKRGLKTTYYVRSRVTGDIEECESCAS